MVRSGRERPACNRGQSQGGRQWAFRPGDQFYASAAADSRFLYTVGCRNDRGRIFCLESQSGSVVWSCAPTHYAATFSSPVITDEFLVVGEGLHHTRTARVVCVDLRPGREGTIAWTLRTNSHVECTPVIYNERVYVAAGDDGIYCLRLTPELGGKPRVVWHRAGGDYPDAETSLILHEGLLYLGLGVGGQSLCVLDAHSGREKTRLQMPFPVFSPPSIHREKLYFGMGQGDYVTPHRDLAGQVCCLDLATLTIDWTLKTPGTVLGAVTVVLAANDENSSEIFWLACGCSDGTLLLLNPAWPNCGTNRHPFAHIGISRVYWKPSLHRQQLRQRHGIERPHIGAVLAIRFDPQPTSGQFADPA